MLFLTSIYLNLRNSRVRQDLANSYRMHQTLMIPFPERGYIPNGQHPRSRFRILYRVEHFPTRRRIRVLLQSSIQPDLHKLPSGYVLSADEIDQPIQTKEIGWRKDRLKTDQLWQFTLEANPVRTMPGNDHRRRDLKTPQEQLGWIRRIGAENGFQLEGFVSMTSKFYRFKRPRSKKELRILGVTYQGILRIMDPIKVWTKICSGIGKNKSFGFGLLSISPV